MDGSMRELGGWMSGWMDGWMDGAKRERPGGAGRPSPRPTATTHSWIFGGAKSVAFLDCFRIQAIKYVKMIGRGACVLDMCPYSPIRGLLKMAKMHKRGAFLRGTLKKHWRGIIFKKPF